jgi:hypothetical protein
MCYNINITFETLQSSPQWQINVSKLNMKFISFVSKPNFKYETYDFKPITTIWNTTSKFDQESNKTFF